MKIPRRIHYSIESQRRWKKDYTHRHGKEHISHYNKTYYETHKEEILALKRQYYKENSESRKAYQHEYSRRIQDKSTLQPSEQPEEYGILAQSNPFR